MEELNSGQLLKHINDVLDKLANNALRKNDLTRVQLWLLGALLQKDDHTLTFKEAEKVMGVAQSTSVGVISRMAEKGLVTCFGDRTDKRVKRLKITRKGEAAYHKAQDEIEGLEGFMLSGLSDDEQQALHELLFKVHNTVR